MTQNDVKKGILSGLTAACTVGAYSICVTSALGLNIWCAFLCAVCCGIFSVGLRDKIYCPMVYFAVPLTVLTGSGLSNLIPICCVFGAVIYFILSKTVKKTFISASAQSGIFLGVSLLATIIFTNLYFGIGANGATGINMLSSYRSLGFHPDFRGLLYGTITLFAMITYPFKYKKLNKHLPAEFMTLLIPLLLNLFLNPQKELTMSNELISLEGADFSQILLIGNITENLSLNSVALALYCGVAMAILLFICKEKEDNSLRFSVYNIANGILSGVPVKEREIPYYSPLSAVIGIAVCGAVMFGLNGIIARIPMYSVGALLIVSAWQNIPYKKLSQGFKEYGVFALVQIIICVVSFVIFDITTAMIISIAISFIGRRLKGDKG